MSTPRARDRGDGTLQLPLVVIVFVGFAALIAFCGRVNDSHARVDAAARYSARTISLARDPAAAIDAARADAAATVHPGSTTCRSMDFDATIEAGQVTVTLMCIVDLSDVDLLGIPGDYQVTAIAEEPLDLWRENSGGFGMSEGSDGSNPSVGVAL
jgi:hypothetical protein